MAHVTPKHSRATAVTLPAECLWPQVPLPQTVKSSTENKQPQPVRGWLECRPKARRSQVRSSVRSHEKGEQTHVLFLSSPNKWNKQASRHEMMGRRDCLPQRVLPTGAPVHATPMADDASPRGQSIPSHVAWYAERTCDRYLSLARHTSTKDLGLSDPCHQAMLSWACAHRDPPLGMSENASSPQPTASAHAVPAPFPLGTAPTPSTLRGQAQP